jgi:hypothetical protein
MARSSQHTTYVDERSRHATAFGRWNSQAIGCGRRRRNRIVVHTGQLRDSEELRRSLLIAGYQRGKVDEMADLRVNPGLGDDRSAVGVPREDDGRIRTIENVADLGRIAVQIGARAATVPDAREVHRDRSNAGVLKFLRDRREAPAAVGRPGYKD